MNAIESVFQYLYYQSWENKSKNEQQFNAIPLEFNVMDAAHFFFFKYWQILLMVSPGGLLL